MNRLLSYFVIFMGFVLAAVGAASEEGRLTLRDIKVGDGREAFPHSMVVVQYDGFLADGTRFDSSRTSGGGFAFMIGIGEVIKGWEEGVTGMREGGRRELIIPPHLAYGAKGVPGKIPPNATLRFDIFLVEAEPPSYSTIGPAQVAGLLGKGAVLIDVRIDAERAKTGVIKGSRAISATSKTGRLNRHFLSRLIKIAEKDVPLILVSQDGRLSAHMANILARGGRYETVYSLKGGIKAWIKAGNRTGK